MRQRLWHSAKDGMKKCFHVSRKKKGRNYCLFWKGSERIGRAATGKAEMHAGMDGITVDITGKRGIAMVTGIMEKADTAMITDIAAVADIMGFPKTRFRKGAP